MQERGFGIQTRRDGQIKAVLFQPHNATSANECYCCFQREARYSKHGDSSALLHTHLIPFLGGLDWAVAGGAYCSGGGGMHALWDLCHNSSAWMIAIPYSTVWPLQPAEDNRRQRARQYYVTMFSPVTSRTKTTIRPAAETEGKRPVFFAHCCTCCQYVLWLHAWVWWTIELATTTHRVSPPPPRKPSDRSPLATCVPPPCVVFSLDWLKRPAYILM